MSAKYYNKYQNFNKIVIMAKKQEIYNMVTKLITYKITAW